MENETSGNFFMNCIDAIEGSAKNIIIELHGVFMDDKLDDSEYIRNVKAVLNGISEFVRTNKEIISDFKILEQVLYEFSRELWLSELEKGSGQEPETGETADDSSENKEYLEYYFDYIYAHGTYPR
jgi:hypothetical protein